MITARRPDQCGPRLVWHDRIHHQAEQSRLSLRAMGLGLAAFSGAWRWILLLLAAAGSLRRDWPGRWRAIDAPRRPESQRAHLS